MSVKMQPNHVLMLSYYSGGGVELIENRQMSFEELLELGWYSMFNTLGKGSAEGYVIETEPLDRAEFEQDGLYGEIDDEEKAALDKLFNDINECIADNELVVVAFQVEDDRTRLAMTKDTWAKLQAEADLIDFIE